MRPTPAAKYPHGAAPRGRRDPGWDHAQKRGKPGRSGTGGWWVPSSDRRRRRLVAACHRRQPRLCRRVRGLLGRKRRVPPPRHRLSQHDRRRPVHDRELPDRGVHGPRPGRVRRCAVRGWRLVHLPGAVPAPPRAGLGLVAACDQRHRRVRQLPGLPRLRLPGHLAWPWDRAAAAGLRHRPAALAAAPRPPGKPLGAPASGPRPRPPVGQAPRWHGLFAAGGGGDGAWRADDPLGGDHRHLSSPRILGSWACRSNNSRPSTPG
jgi:hypothetical protein